MFPFTVNLTGRQLTDMGLGGGREGTQGEGLVPGDGGGGQEQGDRKQWSTSQLPVLLLVDRVIQALPLGCRVRPASAVQLAKAMTQAGMPEVADGLGLCFTPLLLFPVCKVGQKSTQRP